MSKFTSLVEHYFPLSQFREHQKETIVKILEAYNNGKTTVVLEAPTGSGKSVIGMTVAKIYNSAYYITAQKILQSSLEKDFSDWAVVLKGRNEYPCWMLRDKLKTDKYATADKGMCVLMGKSKLPICAGSCKYQQTLLNALDSPITIFNFSSFLFQTMLAKRFIDQRELILIDESHGVEPQIMNFVEVKIDGDQMDINLPSFETAEEYKQYFSTSYLTGTIDSNISHWKDELISLIGTDDIHKVDHELLSSREIKSVIRELQKWESIKVKYSLFQSYIDNVPCVAEFKENAVLIKPLKANYHTPKLLLNMGKRHLLMSATILNHEVYGKSVGLDLDKTEFIRVPHTFPVKNRLIHLDYAGSMKYKYKNQTMPKMIEKVSSIMGKHADVRGMIHCQSFALLKTMCDGLPRKHSKRLIHQLDCSNKDDLLDLHMGSYNSVIIAPAMHEGVDLIDDCSRFQIILKVPYPSFKDDKQLQLRMKEDWSYYLWLVACKICQSYGRSIRSPDDYAETYICDSDFTDFYGRCVQTNMLPDWFCEALRIDGESVC